jgi:hypothetical protein
MKNGKFCSGTRFGREKTMVYLDNHDIFPHSKENLLGKFMKSEPLDVFKEGHFNRGQHKDVDLIVAQILLWPMLSKKANQSLSLLFSNSNPSECQQQKGDSGGPGTDAKIWTMNFFHSVTESVYYSYTIWKENFFVKKEKNPSAMSR